MLDFFIDKESKKIDEEGLVRKIRYINPQMVIMIICYSQIIELKFLLERTGIFAELRMNRELNILSNGQILTMNEIQKDFIQTLAHEDNVEKNVIVTGLIIITIISSILQLEALKIPSILSSLRFLPG